MQAAAEHFVEARESWDLQNLAMHNAEIVPVILENTWGRIAGALGRELLRSGVAEMRQRRDGDQLTMTLRLWGGSGRRD